MKEDELQPLKDPKVIAILDGLPIQSQRAIIWELAETPISKLREVYPLNWLRYRGLGRVGYSAMVAKGIVPPLPGTAKEKKKDSRWWERRRLHRISVLHRFIPSTRLQLHKLEQELVVLQKQNVSPQCL